MITAKRLRWFSLLFVLVVSNVATYKLAPYFKEVENYVVFIQQRPEIPTSQMDREAYIVVIVKDTLVIINGKDHRDWAKEVISDRPKFQWEYFDKQSHLGHTGIVFKLLDQPVASQ